MTHTNFELIIFFKEEDSRRTTTTKNKMIKTPTHSSHTYIQKFRFRRLSLSDLSKKKKIQRKK